MFAQIFTASTGAMLLLCLLGSCRSENERQDIHPQTHIVEIRDFAFVPPILSVLPGDSIRWINKDFVPHTVTDESGRWDSGQLNEEDSWAMVVETAASYYCVYHPAMKGEIKILRDQ